MTQVLRDSRTRYITQFTTPKTTQSIEISVESLFDVYCFQQICSSVESFIKIDDFKLFCEGIYSTKSTDEVKEKYKLTQQFDKQDSGAHGDIFHDENKIYILKVFNQELMTHDEICNEMFIYLCMSFYSKVGSLTPKIFRWNLNFVLMEFVNATPLKKMCSSQLHINHFGTLLLYLSLMSLFSITHYDLNTGNILVSDTSIFICDFGLSKINNELSEKEKKFDINDIVDHFNSLFSALEKKIINHIINHEKDIFRIYNTLSSLFMGVIITTEHSVGGNTIQMFSCISMSDIVEDNILINFTLPPYSYPLCFRTKTSLPKIVFDKDNSSLNFLGNEGETAVFGGNDGLKSTGDFLEFHWKDFWGIRKRFISQFSSDMDMQQIPPHFIFGEFKFEVVLEEPRCTYQNLLYMKAFYQFCKSKYSSTSIDDVKEEYQVTQLIDSDDIHQDEGKRYILKVFNRSRMSEDEICNELFIFLFLSFTLQVESFYPKLLSWNVEFILIEFVNASPVLTPVERSQSMSMNNLFGILIILHDHNILNILSPKKYSFKPGSIFVSADNDSVCILDFGLKETTSTEDNYKSNMKEFISVVFDQFYKSDEFPRKDFWGIRKRFISQFTSDMDMQRIPPHFLFGEFKFIDALEEPLCTYRNLHKMQEFYQFCKSKYSSTSIDHVKRDNQVTQLLDSDDIHQDEGKRYILKVFNRSRMSEDEICNELFIFLFLSFTLPVESFYPKLLSWNLEFILIEFVNATPSASISIERSQSLSMNNLFGILIILHDHNILHILSPKEYSFKPGSILVSADNDSVCILDFGLKETTNVEDNYESNMEEFISDIFDQFYKNDEFPRKDFWGIRTRFISQFTSDMDIQQIPPHFIFGEFKFNVVLKEPRRTDINLLKMEEFYQFCKSKYSNTSIDHVKGEYQVTQVIDSDDIYQDEGKTYILKVFNRSRMSEDEICNELFIFLFLSFTLQDQSFYPKLLSWNVEFILIEFVNATPSASFSIEQSQLMSMINLFGILSRLHDHNILNILSPKKYSFKPGSILVSADNDSVCILDFGLKETTSTEDNYQSNMKEFIYDTIDHFCKQDEEIDLLLMHVMELMNLL